MWLIFDYYPMGTVRGSHWFIMVRIHTVQHHKIPYIYPDLLQVPWDFLIFLAYISPQCNNLSSQNFTNTIDSRPQFSTSFNFLENQKLRKQLLTSLLINKCNTYKKWNNIHWDTVVLNFVEFEIIFIIFIPPSTGKYALRLNEKTLL